MVDKINTYVGRGLGVESTGRRPVDEAQRAVQKAPAKPAARGTDAVRLTDTVAHLKKIEVRLAQVPAVDQARVQAMRQKIQSGQYRIDAASLADKLLQMEQDLARVR